ncbi:MAG: DeoR/GlpR family DNA-binding transcription regulator [Actinobacteria bacterium]|nr:DeoR/GlpR family DNA-binding transcription regulator [Actinomycetota bacterium]
MLGEERREYILNLVNKAGSAAAIDIARALNVSETTIRRDLNKLSKKGLIRRTHGGAINKLSVGQEMKFEVQKEKFIEEKKKIALAAAELIEEGDVILIEAGTTGLQTALNITSRKQLTIVTNSCDIAVLLGKTNPGYSIILSGGILKTDTHSLVGPIAEQTFRHINVDKAFIGISGLDIEKGITAADQIEAKTKMNIIGCAKKVIALCDHSKIGHVSMNFVAPIQKINVLITDSEADREFLEKIKELEIEIIIK